jgi:methionyl-tRNA synthetase
MSKSNTFYISTSIAYVNAGPHVGYAMELLQADALARFHRLEGKEVFYLTGTDEHGLKIAQVAEERGVWPQELANENSALFRDLAEKLQISNDYFVRTTEEKHITFVQDMWRKLALADDLYKSHYEGLYCIGCEKFVAEKELIEGNCQYHNKPPVKVKEENYFFRLSKYTAEIREAINSDRVLVVPASRKQEILNFIDQGLEDVSFSRPRESVKWGIEVPNDPDQLMYVWCDALTNYASVIDREKFWPANVHLIGKDILRFHAVYWVGMLLSAKMELPRAIMVHGHILSEGVKMSKSLGNVKDPFEYVEKFGVEALRYFLLREIPTLDDGDFSQSRFEIVYKEDLANTFGNLVSRVLSMNAKYFAGKVPTRGVSDGFEQIVGEAWVNYQKAFADYDLKKALEIVVNLGYLANKYVEDNKPWALAKENTVRLAEVIYNLLELIRTIALMLQPYIPFSAEKVLKALSIEGSLWNGQKEFGLLQEGLILGDTGILFPRKEG